MVAGTTVVGCHTSFRSIVVDNNGQGHIAIKQKFVVPRPFSAHATPCCDIFLIFFIFYISIFGHSTESNFASRHIYEYWIHISLLLQFYLPQFEFGARAFLFCVQSKSHMLHKNNGAVKIHWPVFDDGDLLNFVECVPSTSTPPSAIRQYPPRSTSSRSQFEWVKQDISDNTYLIPPISLAPIQIGWVNWYHSLIGWLRLSHQSRTHSSPIAAKSIKSTSNRCINKL